MPKGFDPQCLNLAEYFLPTGASARLTHSLAQEIQDSIEDWMEHGKAKIEAELRDEA